MPTDLGEASSGTGELIFPDDATGNEYRLREQAVYDADEVRAEIGNDDVPRFGRWLPVENGAGNAWLSAPSALIDELQQHEIGNDPFRIVTMEKPGHEESNPYRVEIETARDEHQAGL